MKIIGGLFALITILSVNGCVSTDSTWYKNYDGNQLEIKSGHVGDEKTDAKRFVIVTNTNRTWVGSYKGGEEMVPKRKELLFAVGKDEIQKVCSDKVYTLSGEPDYVMLDRSPNVFGGGLIGYALASGLSEYENLPTAMNLGYKCQNNNVQ